MPKPHSLSVILLIALTLAVIPMISESSQILNSEGRDIDNEFSLQGYDKVSSESPSTSSVSITEITSPIFSDVAVTAGIDFEHFRSDDFFSMGAGVAIIDFNNDNLLDIYVTNSGGSNAL